MRKNNRNSQIMWINALAILLVVVGHADMTPAYDALWIKRWIYSFHMPLFVFVSGFLFCYTNPQIKEVSIGRFLLKKVRRLLLPFIVINSIIFLIKTFFSSDDYVQHPVVLTWDSYVDSTFFHPIGFMWFLPALFMIFVFYIVIAKQIGFEKKRPISLVKKAERVENIQGNNLFVSNSLIDKEASASSSFLVRHYLDGINRANFPNIYRTLLWLGSGFVCWGISQCFPHILFMQISSALWYSVYFVLGVVYAMHKKWVDSLLTKYRWICLIVFGGLSFALVLPSLLAAWVGILFVLSLSLWVQAANWHQFMLISNYSFTIYLLSYFPQMLIRGPIYHHFEGINEYVFSVFSILMGVLVPISIGMIYVRIKSKNQITNFLGNIIGL